ncbi:MAG: hypothetical protein D8M58_02800 [Calditrichaeota bacterium]|nr:MAG: hypothetical protein DWQ03_04280 [Calditrichota bacterium]MBL1204293.1 hypothetical protein [Calditrichota bacterium]NOG44123.1 hypothetical protein [Calditrichota bacterium]
MKKILVIFLAVFLITACSKQTSDSTPEDLTYAEAMEKGITAFESSDYQDAVSKFNSALEQNADSALVYTWLGWASFKADILNDANTFFSTGSSKINPDVDLYAGHSFVLNALKEYSESNSIIDTFYSALDDSVWSFNYGLDIGLNHIYLLSAQNYFALGDYSESLDWVQVVDPEFSVNVNTTEGLADLADKIEELINSL